MSVRLFARNNSALTGQIFIKFCISEFFENLSKKFKLHQILTRKTGSVHEDHYTFFIISLSLLLIARNASDKICRENQNSILCSITFFFAKIVPFMR